MLKSHFHFLLRLPTLSFTLQVLDGDLETDGEGWQSQQVGRRR